MMKRLGVGMTVLGALLFLPVAMGDFSAVAPASATPAVPEPGTLVLLTVGFIGAGIAQLRKGR